MIEEYNILLKRFSNLNYIENRNPTFMEIAGYPHFENVSSNILAFYFDTQNPHNFKDLFILSLLQLINIDPTKYSNLDSTNIIRELVTDKGKRIDLFIEFEEFTITIENKIFHYLNNDLNNYQDFINSKHTDKDNYFIVLAPKSNQTNNFYSITYDTFFEQIKTNLGLYILNANNEYLNYLKDYILTLNNITKMPEVNKEFYQFFIENKNQIDQLNTQIRGVQKLFIQFIKDIKNEINLPTNTNDFELKKWIYINRVIVIDIKFTDVTLSFDIEFNYDNYKIDFFSRTLGNDNRINKTNLIVNNSFQRNQRGYIIKEKDINFFEIDKTELINEIENFIKQAIV